MLVHFRTQRHTRVEEQQPNFAEAASQAVLEISGYILDAAYSRLGDIYAEELSNLGAKGIWEEFTQSTVLCDAVSNWCGCRSAESERFTRLYNMLRRCALGIAAPETLPKVRVSYTDFSLLAQGYDLLISDVKDGTIAAEVEREFSRKYGIPAICRRVSHTAITVQI